MRILVGRRFSQPMQPSKMPLLRHFIVQLCIIVQLCKAFFLAAKCAKSYYRELSNLYLLIKQLHGIILAH
jgi:hypothetical protein